MQKIGVNKTFLKYLDHLKRVKSRQGNCLHGFRKQFLLDPGKPGSTYLSTFLKKDEFIPEMESRKPLLPSSLRKLESVLASEMHSPKNSPKANTYVSEALRLQSCGSTCVLAKF